MRRLLATKFLKHHKRGLSALHGKGLRVHPSPHHSVHHAAHHAAAMEGEGRKKIAPLRFKNLRIK